MAVETRGKGNTPVHGPVVVGADTTTMTPQSQLVLRAFQPAIMYK
jgi:hypothetical protein